MILITEAFKKANLYSKIILTVHDELIFNILDGELVEAGRIISNIMNRELKVGKHHFRIPIDAEKGSHWGSLKGFDLLTGEYTDGGSKH